MCCRGLNACEDYGPASAKLVTVYRVTQALTMILGTIPLPSQGPTSQDTGALKGPSGPTIWVETDFGFWFLEEVSLLSALLCQVGS